MKLPVPAFGHAFHLVGGSERLFPNRPQSPSAVRHRVPEKYRADVAQLVEQLIRNQQVSGSNPLVGSSLNPAIAGFFQLPQLVVESEGMAISA